MVNNPELINKIIKQLNNVPDNILDEVVNEILEEDKYFNAINEIPVTSYKQQVTFKEISDLSYFNFLHINSTRYSKIKEIS